MRTVAPLLVVLLSWALPAAAQPSADPPPEPVETPTEAVETPTEAAGTPTQVAETPLEDAAEVTGSSTRVAEPLGPPSPAVPEGLPGDCPAPAARTIEDRLGRSDEGDATADLDLAACWRLLEQPYPETVALDRALDRGLAEPAAAAARQRLADLGGAPLADDAGVDDAGDDLAALDVAADDEDDALAAYILAGVAGAGLIAGTAFGLATLHESSRAERELAGDTLELEYGIVTGVCLGLGLAAGIAAIVLWPDATTGPAPGPGDVGLGWEVWW